VIKITKDKIVCFFAGGKKQTIFLPTKNAIAFLHLHKKSPGQNESARGYDAMDGSKV